MDANTKRALSAAIRAAQSAAKADEKLNATTADFIAAAGGFDEAAKVLNAARAKGRTWKDERGENTPLWKVYNAVAAAKSRAKPKAERKPRQAKADKADAGKADNKADKAEQAAASKPASPADIMAVVLSWTPAQLAQAIREQTAVLERTAIDTLTETLGLLINQAPKAPTKAPAPRKAPAKRATRK